MMADMNNGPGWSAAQWEMVNNAVTESFGKASVAGAFLPCYGPLPESAEYVRDEKFTETGATVKIGDDTTLKLFNLTVKVELSSEQVAEDTLSGALLAFRRAANTLAQVEDHLVFNGFGKFPTILEELRDAQVRATGNVKQLRDAHVKATATLEELTLARTRAAESWESAKGKISADRKHETEQEMMRAEKEHNDVATNLQAAEQEHKDLATALKDAKQEHHALATALKDTENIAEKAARFAPIVVAHPVTSQGLAEISGAPKVSVAELQARKLDVGELLVAAVVKAMADLEDDSHPGPFACVLGSNLFEEAHRPVKQSMVLPADRITPLLNGPLLRSGQMDRDTGIVVSLAASDIDIVVATAPKAQFLQVTNQAKYLFRVYEKFVLRIKDQAAVHRL